MCPRQISISFLKASTVSLHLIQLTYLQKSIPEPLYNCTYVERRDLQGQNGRAWPAHSHVPKDMRHIIIPTSNAPSQFEFVVSRHGACLGDDSPQSPHPTN